MADEGDKLVSRTGPVSFTLTVIYVVLVIIQMLNDLHTFLDKVSTLQTIPIAQLHSLQGCS